MVFQLQDNNNNFSGKSFDWDANKSFFKNLADKVFIAPTSEQLSLLKQYNDLAGKAPEIQKEFLKTFDDTDPLKTYFTTLDGGIATQKGMTGALNKTTLASKATAASMTLLNAAMNMGIMLAVSAAITGIVKGLDYLIVTLKEQKEIVEQASTEFKTLTSDIEALNKQLATSATRIDELNDKDTLSLIEQEELARLKETNTELAIQLALKEKDAELTAKKLAAETETLFNKSYNSVSLDENRVPEYKTQLQENDTLLEDIIIGSNNISATVAAYEHLIDVRNKAIAQGKDGAEDALKANEQLSAVETHLLGFSQSLQSMQSTLLDVENPSQAQLDILEQTSSWLNTINSLIIPEKWKSIKFDEVFNADDLKSSKEALIEAAKAGKLDESDINKYSDFSSRLDEVGISAKEAAAQLNAMYASQDVDQTPDLKPLALEEANKLLDETQSKYQSLAKSIEEYNTSNIMTIDNMQSIIGLGNEYLQFMSIENGQIKMNQEGLVQLALARIDDAEAAYLQEATNLVATLTDEKTASEFLKTATEDEAKARLSNAEAAWEEAHALAATNAAKTGSTLLAESIKTLEANVGNASAVFDAARNSIGSYTDTAMGAASATDKLAEAQKDLEDSLRAEGEAGIRVIDRKIKSIQDAQKASEKAIDSQIDGIKEEQEAYEKAIDAEIDKLNERKEALEENIKKDEDAASVVVDLIQEQIDAIDKQKDKVNEFYDEQLDALEKVNKELQDQIDRENALEDLQKAKSQRLLVYRKGEGFVEAENEGAVKDAQDNYDQVLADQVLQAEKDRLEEERNSKLEALDAEKKLLEEYQKLWSDSTSKYEEEMRRKHALEMLGQGYEQAILEQRTDILDKFTQFHYDQTVELEENVLTQLETLQKQKEEEAILFEERMADLEEQKAREAENYAVRIEDLNGYKEQVQEGLNLIGKSWEEYQDTLNYEAKWEAALLDGMAEKAWEYAESVKAAIRSAQDAIKDGNTPGSNYGASSNSSGKSSQQVAYEKKKQENLMAQGLSTGGMVTEPGLFITDEDGKKEVKVGVRAGKATLLDKGDMVFPHGTPVNLFSAMMGFAREHPLIPERIQESNDNMGRAINNTTVNRKEEVNLQFYGDLSFPNITDPNDSKRLVRALLDMGRESYQLNSDGTML